MRLVRISALIVFVIAVVVVASFAFVAFYPAKAAGATPAGMAQDQARASVPNAMSVMFNTTYTGWICGNTDRADKGAGVAPRNGSCEGSRGDPRIQNPHMSVSYHVKITDTKTGSPVACNSSVPAGTELSLQFVPHDYQDVYWLATGSAIDSPYGYWVSKAGIPAGGICAESNYIRSGDAFGKMYTALSVDPPVETMSGIDSMGCFSNGNGTVLCTTPTGGTFNPTFNFAPTTGKFWFDWSSQTYRHFGKVGCSADSPLVGEVSPFDEPNIHLYTLQVPKQSISCSITVTGSSTSTPPNMPPTKPTLATAAASSGACVVGTPYSLTMSASDPEGDTLRYGVDWDADGSIDQFIPASGYVPSGTAQTASRTYSTSGNKTVKVLAEDVNGNASGWATLTFSCNAPPTQEVDTGFNGNDNTNTNTNNNDNQNNNLPPTADLNLRVTPSLVHSGDTTKVNWSASNVSSCIVTGQNGDLWNTIASIVGGNTSKPITVATTYTLKCIDLTGATKTKTATVNVLPSFKEL